MVSDILKDTELLNYASRFLQEKDQKILLKKT